MEESCLSLWQSGDKNYHTVPLEPYGLNYTVVYKMHSIETITVYYIYNY